MKTIKIDLSKIKPSDLDGKIYPLPDVGQVVGNHIYKHSDTIELLEISKKLHAGKTAECSAEDLERIIMIVSKLQYYLAFAQYAIMDYLNSLLNNK